MSRNWRIYLKDMREFCDRIISFMEGVSREQFEQHGLVYDGVIRNIELLGEAARQIPEEVRAKGPGIDWARIVALRNLLIHAYFGIDDDIVWDVVVNKIPSLKKALEQMEERSPEFEDK